MLSPSQPGRGDRFNYLANALAMSTPAGQMPATPASCDVNKENGDRCAAIARMQLMQPHLTARQIHEAFEQCQSRAAAPSPDTWKGN